MLPNKVNPVLCQRSEHVTYDRGLRIEHAYASLRDFAIAYRDRTSSWQGPRSHIDDERRNKFAMANPSEAFQHATCGWNEGVAKMKRGLEIAAASQVAPQSVIALDVAGAYPHAAIAATGEPFCMVDCQPDIRARRPVFKIILQNDMRGDAKDNHVINRGIAVLSAIDSLENSGIRCELIVMNTYSNDKSGRSYKELRSYVTVKNAEDHLDLAACAFAFAHPSMERRLGFAALETEDTFEDDFGGHYGCGIDADASMFEGAIFLGEFLSASIGNEKYPNIAAACETIAAQIAAQTGTDTNTD